MAKPVSQGVTVTLGGSSVSGVTQVTINETCPQVETSDLSLPADSQRTYIKGLKDAADITINTIGTQITTGDQPGGFACGSISFGGATVMSSEVAYRVGEVVSYTATVRAANN